jgi:hypothetical protein
MKEYDDIKTNVITHIPKLTIHRGVSPDSFAVFVAVHLRVGNATFIIDKETPLRLNNEIIEICQKLIEAAETHISADMGADTKDDSVATLPVRGIVDVGEF